MPKIIGKILEKSIIPKPLKAILIIESKEDGTHYLFQIRAKNINKIALFDTHSEVVIYYENELSRGINNLILKNIEKL